MPSLATNVTVTANNTANENIYLTLVDVATGTQGIETDVNLAYNPSTNTLTTGTFSGTLSGNASSATIANHSTYITVNSNNFTDETVYLTFVDTASETLGIETDTGLTYNPSSNVLSTGTFSGNLQVM